MAKKNNRLTVETLKHDKAARKNIPTYAPFGNGTFMGHAISLKQDISRTNGTLFNPSSESRIY